jgi:solute carrier family 35 protein F5
LSHEQHIRIAVKIAPVWFLANWTYNLSLAYTSITSSTVLASTGSLFTFIFAVACGDESFTLPKLFGVVLCVTGSILTALHDFHPSSSDDNHDDSGASTSNTTAISVVAGHLGTPHHHFRPDSGVDPWEGHALLGDLLGLLSAVGYGTYTVMIRVYCPRDESSMSMQLLLGYIGLLNAIVLSPITLNKLVLSATTAEHLTWLIFGYLVVKGLLDNVLSDYLWARAVLLTSATIATVGLGLTIPLAFASDWVLGHEGIMTLESIFGALAVLIGFILVNLYRDGDDEEEAVIVQDDEHLDQPVSSVLS